MIPVTIIRHPKERLAKCSLQPLVDREGFSFYQARQDFTFDATGYTMLGLEGEEIGPTDADRPLLLLDGTWRLVEAMAGKITGSPVPRTLPTNIKTAYPRVSKLYTDPVRGLASIEALYAALALMGEQPEDLLTAYHWAHTFRELNRELFSG